MTFDWWTFGLQTVNFVVLAWLLHRLLYRPVRRVLAERASAGEAALTEARAAKDEAERARAAFEADRAALAGERQAMRREIHDELEAERRRLREEAAGRAASLLEEARATIARERDAALAALERKVVGLGVAIARRLLAQARPAGVDTVFLEEIEARLQALPEAERARLRGDAAAGATVATAAPLPPDAAETWRGRLAALIGGAAPGFVVEPALLGGAELRLPHAVIRSSWAETLAAAPALLAEEADAADRG